MTPKAMIATVAAFALGWAAGRFGARSSCPEADELRQQVEALVRRNERLEGTLRHHVDLALQMEAEDQPFRRDLVVGWARISKEVWGW